MVRSTWYFAALCFHSSCMRPSRRVSPTPGYAVSTTGQPELWRPVVSAGVAENMPESPTIIAVPRRGSANLPAADAARVVVGRAAVGAGATVRAAERTTGGTRSVRMFEYANAGPTGSATRGAAATPTLSPPASATRRGRAIVSGCSITNHDTAVPSAVNPSRATASTTPVAPMRSGVINTTAGQCQRYTPYDTRPSRRSGPRSSTAVSGPGTVVATVTSAAAIATSANPPRYKRSGASVIITAPSATITTGAASARARRLRSRR